MQETWVRSLDREDPLEKEMATPFSILAWEIPWTQKPGALQSMESQNSQTRLSNWTTTIPSIAKKLEKLEISYWNYPVGPVVKNSPANKRDTGSIPGPEKCHMPWATKPVHHNYWAHALEHVLCNKKSLQWEAHAL